MTWNFLGHLNVTEQQIVWSVEYIVRAIIRLPRYSQPRSSGKASELALNL